MMFTADVGRRKRSRITVNPNDFGNRRTVTGASMHDVNRAENMLADVITSVLFTAPHYRNDAAVNSCIALHVLGFDPKEWFEDFFKVYSKLFYAEDVADFMEHVDRVMPYLWKWGAEGYERQALDFAV